MVGQHGDLRHHRALCAIVSVWPIADALEADGRGQPRTGMICLAQRAVVARASRLAVLNQSQGRSGSPSRDEVRNRYHGHERQSYVRTPIPARRPSDVQLAAQKASLMLTGTITDLFGTYGFIDTGTTRWIFFHKTDVLAGQQVWQSLRCGDRVEFSLSPQGRRRALNVLRQPLSQAARKERCA